jgi:small-conductance mechanosensitive channel
VGDYDYNPNTISDFLVHTLTPILVLLEIIFYQRKGLVKVYYPLIWLVFPLLYWIFTLVYVALGGNFNGETYVSDYPYFFLNFADNGYWGFILVLVFILFIGYLIYYIDKTVYLRQQRREVENGDI